MRLMLYLAFWFKFKVGFDADPSKSISVGFWILNFASIIFVSEDPLAFPVLAKRILNCITMKHGNRMHKYILSLWQNRRIFLESS